MDTQKTNQYPPNWPEIARQVKEKAGWKCEYPTCRHPHDPNAGYSLTVHHKDSDKTNCQPENLIALCQRCHMAHVARLRRYGPEDQRQMRMPIEPQEPQSV